MTNSKATDAEKAAVQQDLINLYGEWIENFPQEV